MARHHSGLGLVLSAVLALLICWHSRDYIFFWDTIQLASRHAHWYYEMNFSGFFLPDEIDSGNPPFFGMYLGLVWMVFGKNLFVSHFAMFPILFFIFYFSFRLGLLWKGYVGGWLFPLILTIHPCFAGHTVLISPDLALLAFLFLALWARASNKSLMLSIAAIGLALVSIRGVLVIVALMGWDIINFRNKTSSFKMNKLGYYIPGILLFMVFQFVHLMYKGWVFSHADSPWSPSFNWAPPMEVIHNLGVFVWRLVDHGHVFVITGIILLAWNRRKWTSSPALRFCAFFVILASAVMIPFQGLMQHRYLLPFYAVSTFALLNLMDWSDMRHRIWFGILLIGLFTGNYWIYPDHIAQGWDSTRAHIPYYVLSEQVRVELNQRQIPLKQVGTKFPMQSEYKYIGLTTEKASFKRADLEHDQYILWSNIHNDYSEVELSYLRTHWEELVHLEKKGIQMIVFARP